MKPALALVPFAAAALLAGCGSSSSSTDTGTSSSAAATTSATTSSSAATSPAVTPLGKASVTLTPNHGKVGSVIHVVGAGYSPGVSVTGTLCAIDASGNVANPLTDCDVVNTVTVTTDAQGGFTTDFAVKRIPPPQAAYTIGFGVQGDNANSAGGVFTVDK